MEHTICLFCHHANYQVLYEDLPDRLTGASGRFRLVACQECGLVYLNPRPTVDELGTYYPDNYEPFLTVAPEEMNALQRWVLNYGLKKRAAPLLKAKGEGRLLDIGCATGQYLDYIRTHSRWEVVGVELDQYAAAFARRQFGLEVHIGDLMSAGFPDNYFDAVTMWDVLEHLPDPIETLQEIRRILKPAGQLLFRVPVIDSLDANLFGRYWAGLDAPRHFYIFSEKTLAMLLAETGFNPLRTWCISGSFFVFAISFQFWLEACCRQSKIARLAVRLFRSIPVRLLTLPYFYLVDRLKQGPQLAVLSVKAG